MPGVKIDRLKLLTHILALLPLARLIWDGYFTGLSYDPIREITFRTGRDALVLLLLTLAVSPVSQLTGWRGVRRLRRTLGLYAFFYASLHFLTFVGLDFGFNLDLIINGIFARPFAIVGFSAFIILLPLAITSTNAWRRRLGKNWARLHQLIYPAAVLVIIHFLWAAKQDYEEPATYGAIVIFLLGWRLLGRPRRQSDRAPARV